MIRSTLAGLFFGLALTGCAGLRAASSGDPAEPPYSLEQRVAAARAEGKVVVYSVLSNKAAAPLVRAFQALYPGIAVDYDGEGGSTETYERFVKEVDSGRPSADVMWSSAMDLQMKLVADGYAARHVSPQAGGIPAWARFKDQAWGTTYEPVVFIYNKQRVPQAWVPTDHASFAATLDEHADEFKGKVATFDITRSGVGYMFAVQDARHPATTDKLLSAMGRAGVRLSAGTGEVLGKVNSGEYLLGYNIMGAYALTRSQTDLGNIGVSFARDFTQILSRIMFISKRASHPHAARLWVDFMLSAQGQKVIGDQLGLFAIRDDANAASSASSLVARLGGAAQPIPINLDLVEPLDPKAMAPFVADWKRRIAALPR